MPPSALFSILLFAALAPRVTVQAPATGKPAAVIARMASDSLPAVNVEAQRLEGGRLQVTFTYYAHATGKLEQLKCSGSLSQIEGEVRELGKQNRMSARVQDLVEVGLRRMRALDIPAQELKPSKIQSN
jgi:hypothetical protein